METGKEIDLVDKKIKTRRSRHWIGLLTLMQYVGI